MRRRPVSRRLDAARRIILGPAAAGVAASLIPFTAGAAPAEWLAGSGNWSTPNNWSGRAVPAAGQDVNIKHDDDVERDVNYDYAGPDIDVNVLTLDQLGKATQRISQGGFRLRAEQTIIGNQGQATFVQSGGTHVAVALRLGAGAAGYGTYQISGGSLRGDDFFVGSLGSGTFAQSGGSVIPSSLIIAGALRSNGSYQLDGGILDAQRLYVGNEGSGTFVQNGGAVTVGLLDDALAIGRESTGVGDYTLTGGTLNSVLTQVGLRGRGSLTLSGGDANLDHLLIGDFAGSSGTVTVNAGTLDVGQGIRIGGAGHGSYVQSGGVVTVGTNIVVDANIAGGPGSGRLHLTGGALIARGAAPLGILWIDGDSGTVIQDGGSMVVRDVILGARPGGTGVYRLNDGRLDADVLNLNERGTFEYVGGLLNVKNFVHSGGTVTGNLVNRNTYTYNRGAFPGKLINQGNVVLNGNLTLGNGLENEALLTIPGGRSLTLSATSRNHGSLVIDGGTLASDNLLFNLGHMTARGTLSGAGTFQNNGHFTQGDGDLRMLPVGGQLNVGTFNLAPARTLSLESVLTNDGILNLNGGTLVGPGNFHNRAAGLITGPGTIVARGSNLGTIVIPAGQMLFSSVSTNAGSIILDAPTAKLDGGGRINNLGSIHGRGVVGAGISNHGLVEAVGGTLTLGGAQFGPSSFVQFPDGTLAAGPGGQLHVTNGLGSNAGSILLTGGAFHDHGATALHNTGKIRGNGVFRAAGLNNAGEIGVSFGNLDLDATLTNTATGKVIVSGGATATFHKSVSGVAGTEIRVGSNSAAVFFAPVSGPITFTGTGGKFFEAGPSAVGPVAAGGATTILESATLTVDHFRERSLAIEGRAVVRPNGTATGTSKVSQLSIGPAGQLDLADNALIVDYTGASAASEVRAQLRSAYAGGAWTGPGITSASGAANLSRSPGYGEATDLLGPGGGTFQGLAVDGSAILVRFTVRGDANLDGTVSFPDLVAVAQNYNTTDGSALWTRGDFNFDGDVTFVDLVALAQNYNTSIPAAGAIPGARLGFEEEVARAFAQVPEPSLVAPLALVACGLAHRGRCRKGGH